MPYCRSDVPLLLRGHRGGSFLRVGGAGRPEGQRMGGAGPQQGRRPGRVGRRVGSRLCRAPPGEPRTPALEARAWATAGSERCAWGAEMRGLQQE